MKAIASAARKGTLVQMIGVFTGPAAWSVQLLVNSNLEDTIACTPGAGHSAAILGIGIKSIIFWINLLAAAATLAAGIVSFAYWRRIRAQDSTTGGRAGWMAAAGVMVSVLFFLTILFGFAPLGFLSVCTPSP